MSALTLDVVCTRVTMTIAMAQMSTSVMMQEVRINVWTGTAAGHAVADAAIHGVGRGQRKPVAMMPAREKALMMPTRNLLAHWICA